MKSVGIVNASTEIEEKWAEEKLSKCEEMVLENLMSKIGSMELEKN